MTDRENFDSAPSDTAPSALCLNKIRWGRLGKVLGILEAPSIAAAAITGKPVLAAIGAIATLYPTGEAVYAAHLHHRNYTPLENLSGRSFVIPRNDTP